MVDDIRRSQLTGVFGVGSLRIMVGGTSMMCGSLDLWLHKITKQKPRQQQMNDCLNLAFSNQQYDQNTNLKTNKTEEKWDTW